MDKEKVATTTKGIRNYFVTLFTLVLLGTLAYGVYLNSKTISFLVSTFLYFFITILIIVLIIGLLLGLMYALIHLWKYYHSHEISEVGQYGSVIIRGHKHITINPYQEKVRETREKSKQLEEVKPCPTMQELLISGYITNLIKKGYMLLGYNQETLEERLGTIEDNRTTGIAGKSRSGKTVLEAYLTIIYVLAGAKVYIIDKAWNKPSSLYKLVLPLVQAGYVKVARKPMETVEMIDEYTSMLDERESNEEADLSQTNILLVDEWTSHMHDKLLMKKLVSIVHRITNESAGYNAYAMIGGQNWQPSQAGGNALINSLHSFFVLKIEEMESRRIIDKKIAKVTINSKVGHNYFRDTSGEIEPLICPLTTVHDSIVALQILQGSFNPGTHVNNSYNPFVYQPSFQVYNPKLLTTPDTKRPSPNNPQNKSQAIALSQDDYMEELQPNTKNNQDANQLQHVAGLTLEEEQKIKMAIDIAIEHGKVKANGKITRTYVRDLLEYDNREYKKIELYCNAFNL